jgi:hypothetical protein
VEDWLHAMTTSELAEHATGYPTLAKAAALVSTRETFDRLSNRCAALAAEREAEETRLTRQWADAEGR